MRLVKACCCLFVLGALVAPAVGQDAYLSDSATAAGATGNHGLVFMESGETKTIYVYLEDNVSADGLAFYQLIWQDCTAPGVGATGTVEYADAAPTPGGNTVAIDTGHPDWVFAGAPLPGANPPAFNETLGGCPQVAGKGFGAVSNLIVQTAEVIVTGTKYLAQFDITASPDACGTFTLSWVASGGQPAGGTDFGQAPQGPPPLVYGPPTLENLTIVIGGNDDCVDATPVGNGNHFFTTECATTDGFPCTGIDPGPFGDDDVHLDVWFEYTATCTGTLTASTCNDADPNGDANFDTRIAIYPGDTSTCTPASGTEIGCLDDTVGCGGFTQSLDVAVNSGNTYLIRVGGFGDFDFGSGHLALSCTAACDPALPPNDPQTIADCTGGGISVDTDCTNISCDAVLGCVYTAKPSTTTCDADGDVCTGVGGVDHCTGPALDPGLPGGGGASCAPDPVHPCLDPFDCTLDFCDQTDPGAGPDGCVFFDLNGAPCAGEPDPDAFCQSAGNAQASCNIALDQCECLSGNNTNPQNSLCLDVRNAGGPTFGPCTSDADCGPSPDGILQCSHTGTDPFVSECVDQACYGLNDKIIVDLELGSTAEAACGAQVFLSYDTSSLDFKGLVIDPDGEFGWSQVFINVVDEAAGTIDLALGLPIGVQCNAINGSSTGGTIARLSFNAIANCKSGGVCFRPNNPPTRVGGANGDIPIVGCDSDPCTDEINVDLDPPVWTCPDGSDGDSDCNSILRTIDVDPFSVSDPCENISVPVDQLCTVVFNPGCDDDLDCGNDGLCAQDSDCASNNCVPDAAVDGFQCAGGLPCIGFCSLVDCINGFCDKVSPVDYSGVLNGGTFEIPPGRLSVHCEYTNGCGATGTCDAEWTNSGMNRLCIDVEMSPSMVSGSANNPITRCIDFELSICDSPAGAETITFSAEIDFGAPNNIPGHGSVCVKVPPLNWTCLTAQDLKHSLAASCFIECVDDEFHAEFKGSPTTNVACHWLVQGNLDGDDHIDIVDYTILAGQYLTIVGEDTECKDPNNPPPGFNYHADLNGDGLVALSDFTFIVFNFFAVAKEPCEVLCNPGLAAPKPNPRSEISARELARMGIPADYIQAADVNSDGMVNLVDVAAFLEASAEGDDPLATDLLDAVDSRISESSGLR